MRNLFIAAALMMTSLIAASAQQNQNVQFKNGETYYVVTGASGAPGTVVDTVGDAGGRIAKTSGPVLPGQVFIGLPNGLLKAVTLDSNKILIGGPSGAEVRQLRAGSNITLDTTVSGELTVNAIDTSGGSFGGGLLRFVPTVADAGSFTQVSGDRYQLNLTSGSYFRITGRPAGMSELMAIVDAAGGDSYPPGSLIILENSGAPNIDVVMGAGSNLLVTASGSNMDLDDTAFILFMWNGVKWTQIASTENN